MEACRKDGAINPKDSLAEERVLPNRVDEEERDDCVVRRLRAVQLEKVARRKGQARGAVRDDIREGDGPEHVFGRAVVREGMQVRCDLVLVGDSCVLKNEGGAEVHKVRVCAPL